MPRPPEQSALEEAHNAILELVAECGKSENERQLAAALTDIANRLWAERMAFVRARTEREQAAEREQYEALRRKYEGP